VTEQFDPARIAGSAAPVLVVVLTLDDGSEAVARDVIVATGVTYRRLGIAGLGRFVGTGVFYGAAGVEAPAMAGQEVYGIGGANSAGQAALHLARFVARVTFAGPHPLAGFRHVGLSGQD
jgi:thioredoxin reductase (NADPH)